MRCGSIHLSLSLTSYQVGSLLQNSEYLFGGGITYIWQEMHTTASYSRYTQIFDYARADGLLFPQVNPSP